MNAIAFYIVAVLLLAASIAVVAAPRQHLAAIALGAVALTLALLLLLLSAYAMAVAQVVIPAIAGAAVWLHIRRERRYDGLLRRTASHAVWWAGAAAAALTLLLVVVFALSATGWHVGAGVASLLTVFHYRAVYALLLGIVLTVTAAAIALLIGRVGRDERELERALAARRQREGRERVRREAREAARRRGKPAPALDETA